MNWKQKMLSGLQIVSEACAMNDNEANCRKCPFEYYCDAIIAAHDYAGFIDVTIPENWEFYYEKIY